MRLMLVDRASGCGSERGLEQRVDECRCDRAVSHLFVARSRAVVTDDPIARRVVTELPLELDARFAPGSPAGVHGLRTADQHDVALAVLNALGELVDEELRTVAADRRNGGRARRDVEPAGEQRAGIRIGPRRDLHDRDDVDPTQQRGTGVGLRGAGGGLQEVDGRSGDVGSDSLRRLADAHDDRGTRIHGGRRLPAPAQSSCSVSLRCEHRPRRDAASGAVAADRPVLARTAQMSGSLTPGQSVLRPHALDCTAQRLPRRTRGRRRRVPMVRDRRRPRVAGTRSAIAVGGRAGSPRFRARTPAPGRRERRTLVRASSGRSCSRGRRAVRRAPTTRRCARWP